MTDDKARKANLAPEIGAILSKESDPSCIPNTLTYFYIKHIKGWMDCPVCEGKLLFTEKRASWNCDCCDFSLPEEEFLDNYVFWFCDCCNEFLNTQEGFERNLSSWTCTACGHINNITSDNLKGICRVCGELLDNPNASLCPECEEIYLQATAQTPALAPNETSSSSGSLS